LIKYAIGYSNSSSGGGCLNLIGEEDLSDLVIVGVGGRDDTSIDGGIPKVLSEHSLAELIGVETVSGLNHIDSLTTGGQVLVDGVIENITEVEELYVLELASGLLND
jgi:hypothetical protein